MVLLDLTNVKGNIKFSYLLSDYEYKSISKTSFNTYCKRRNVLNHLRKFKGGGDFIVALDLLNVDEILKPEAYIQIIHIFKKYNLSTSGDISKSEFNVDSYLCVHVKTNKIALELKEELNDFIKELSHNLDRVIVRYPAK